MHKTIDLRDRCARRRCKKLIREGKIAKAQYDKYKPYCSFHCQEWARLEDAQEHINSLKLEGESSWPTNNPQTSQKTT